MFLVSIFCAVLYFTLYKLLCVTVHTYVLYCTVLYVHSSPGHGIAGLGRSERRSKAAANTTDRSAANRRCWHHGIGAVGEGGRGGTPRPQRENMLFKY